MYHSANQKSQLKEYNHASQNINAWERVLLVYTRRIAILRSEGAHSSIWAEHEERNYRRQAYSDWVWIMNVCMPSKSARLRGHIHCPIRLFISQIHLWQKNELSAAEYSEGAWKINTFVLIIYVLGHNTYTHVYMAAVKHAPQVLGECIYIYMNDYTQKCSLEKAAHKSAPTAITSVNLLQKHYIC